jgi:hypothetical protein
VDKSRICSLLNIDEHTSDSEVEKEIVDVLRRASTASENAGDLTAALVAVEVALGLSSTSDVDEATEAIVAAITRLQEGSKGLESALRVAAGFGPFGPIERVMAAVTASRQERDAVRRMLRLDPEAHESVVLKAIGTLREGRASDEEVEDIVRDLVVRLTYAAGIDPSPGLEHVEEQLRILVEHSQRLMSTLEVLGLPQDAGRNRITWCVDALRQKAAKGDHAQLLIERAEAVHGLIVALTSADARMAVSLRDTSG